MTDFFVSVFYSNIIIIIEPKIIMTLLWCLIFYIIFPKRIRVDGLVDRIEEDSTVLDVGCGDGGVLLYMKPKKKLNAVGVENFAVWYKEYNEQ